MHGLIKNIFDKKEKFELNHSLRNALDGILPQPVHIITQ